MEESKRLEMGQPSQSQRTQALERFAVIRSFLEEGVPLTEIVRERALPLRTVRRWVKRYREAGLNGLTRKIRADKGARRGMPEELRRLIEELALQKPRRSVAAIFRHVRRVATERRWPPPSYKQVYTIITITRRKD